MEAQPPEWVLFNVDESRFAIPLRVVERVVAATEVTALPGAPDSIRGVTNVAGEVIPVFDLRRRFSRPSRPIKPADHFLIVNAAGRRAILLIDHASGVLTSAPQALLEAHRVTADLPHIDGLIIADDGLVLIYDADSFLSAAESRELEAALANGSGHAV